jgi:hypothetical protein
MRRILLTVAAAAAILTAPGLLAGSADALTLPSANAVREAADSTNLNVQNVRWVCRWGYYGRRCWWEPGYYRRHWRYRYY